mgnify:CR=1 FL=1
MMSETDVFSVFLANQVKFENGELQRWHAQIPVRLLARV